MNVMTIGADPEVFLFDREKDDYVGAYQAGVRGNKAKPVQIGQFPVAVQCDNVMMEVTGAVCLPDNFSTTWASYKAIIDEYVLSLGDGQYSIPQVMGIDASEAMMRDPNWKMLGCSPDLNAYANQGRTHEQVTRESLGRLRFAGGHLHVGYDFSDKCPLWVAVQLFEVFVGLNVILSGERQYERRKFYGKAGRYRETAYGFEYRTPSNVWFTSSRTRNYVQAGLMRYHQLMQKSANDISAVYGRIDFRQVTNAIENEDRVVADMILNAAGE